MINLQTLEDNLIIITPNTNKDILIKDMGINYPTKHIKFMNKEEVINESTFTYDLKCLNYIKTKYNYSYELAKEILDNLRGIKRFNQKLNKLYDIYLDLLDKDLLKTNPYFKLLFNNKKTYIYGYSKKDIELVNALKSLGIDYEFLEDETKTYKPVVYKFKDMETELTFVLNEICDLISKGISLNNIYIYNIPSEYSLLIKKYFNFHNIKIEADDKVSLYETRIYKEYLDLLNTYDFLESYNILKENTKYDNFDSLGKIVDTVVKLNELDILKDEKIELMNFLSKRTFLKGEHYKESIKIVNSNTIITDNDYVFMLGFSLGSYPQTMKDTDFYLDIEKDELNKNTSLIQNKINEEDLIKFISNTKNLTITFKERVNKTIYYPSLLINKLNLVFLDKELDNVRYSLKLAKKEIACYYDNLKLYGIKNKYLTTFSKEELKYDSFNHEFKGLTSYEKDRPITLSYSQINEYNNCPFSYFVNRILKVNIFDGNFSTALGTLYHQILEDSSKGEINLNNYNDYILENFNTYKEKYFIKKLLPQVLDVISLNKDFLDKSYFDKVYAENRYDIKLDSNTSLMGKIDKIVVDENDKNYIVVDYKTSDFKFNKEKTKYGIDMQLPIYALLLKENYKDYQNCGMYIQNVCLDRDELEKDNIYTLNGITLSVDNKLKRLDPELGTLYTEDGKLIKKSRFVKSLGLKNDGSYSKNSKAYSKEIFDELIETAKNQTSLVVRKIRNGNFEIAPVKFTKEQGSACTYCKNKDICFMKDIDFRKIDLSDNPEGDDE